MSKSADVPAVLLIRLWTNRLRRLFGETVPRKQRADLRSLVDRVWKMTAER